MAWLYSFGYTLGCLLTVINICRISAFFTERQFKIQINSILILTLLIIYICCLSDTVFSSFSPLLTAILYFMHYVMLLLCCNVQDGKKHFKHILYLFAFLLSFSSLFEEITKLIISEYIDIKDRFFLPWTIFLIYSFIIFLVVNAFSYKRLSNVRMNLKAISDKIYILILIDFFIAGGLISIQTAMMDDPIQQIEITKALTILFILISTVIIFTVVSSTVSKNYYERLSNLLEHQIDSELNYYKRIGTLDSELRSFRHDYKNHMLCIHSLIDAQQYEDLKEYISQITNNSIVNEKVYATGNKIADIILSEKNKKAEEHYCSISFLGEISETIPSKDICIILSNSLDNAIEACEKNTEYTNSIIKVNATCAHNMQLIEIQNPMFDKIQIENQYVATTKKDKKQHGFGLYNIRQVTEDHDGVFDIHIDNDNFVLEIGLNLHK